MTSLNRWKRIVIILCVALILVLWLWFTPQGSLGKADAIGFAVCHQINVRSFFIGERQMPMCVRCSGMYIAAMITLAFLFIFHSKKGGMPSKFILFFFACMALAWLVDGVNSFLHLFPGFTGLYEPQNLYRLITGSGMGIVAASFLFSAFNQTVWVDWDTSSAFLQVKTFFALLLCVSIGILLTLTNQPNILYPLALLSALGVLILLCMVYGMIWMMIFKQENQIHTYRELIFPLTVGLGVAILQIGLLDWGRVTLMSGWEGFHLH